jgi:hypothetical protein
MNGVYSSKQSSILSNPDLDPNKENHGVQICAGIIINFGSHSIAISNNFLGSNPTIGLPSE